MIQQPAHSPLTARGVYATVTPEGVWLTVEPKRQRRSIAGTRTIRVDQITSITLRPSGRWRRGYVQFTIAGAASAAPSRQRIGGTSAARQNPDVVIFNRNVNEEFSELAQAVRSVSSAPSQPQ